MTRTLLRRQPLHTTSKKFVLLGTCQTLQLVRLQLLLASCPTLLLLRSELFRYVLNIFLELASTWRPEKMPNKREEFSLHAS